MAKFVPYLAEEAIERNAEALLTEFAHARDVVIEPPIPIEDIMEKYLKLGIEFDDTHRLFGIPRTDLSQGPDILGAIFFDEKRVVVDESLDPEEHPNKEGRYRFTLAHEGGGHWRLHRSLYARDPAQAAQFGGSSVPSVICRSSQAKERVEWQANFYASCLLMPRKLVFRAWKREFGDLEPREVVGAGGGPEDYDREIEEIDPEDKQFLEKLPSPRDLAEMLAEEVARPLAEQFVVSPIAMRIRLEKLCLLIREVPLRRILGAD